MEQVEILEGFEFWKVLVCFIGAFLGSYLLYFRSPEYTQKQRIIFGSLRFTSRIAERYTKIRNDIENLNANLSNSITGILTVKSFNRERKESDRITISSQEVKSANYHAIRLSAAFIPIIRIAILFGFLQHF